MTKQFEVSSDKDKLNMWALSIPCAGMDLPNASAKTVLAYFRVVLTNTFLFSYSYLQFGTYIADLFERLMTIAHEYHGLHYYKTSGQSNQFWGSVSMEKITYFFP